MTVEQYCHLHCLHRKDIPLFPFPRNVARYLDTTEHQSHFYMVCFTQGQARRYGRTTLFSD